MTNILLTGRPGVGKTTLVERIVSELNIPPSGFYTREIREKGKRVGFQLSTWDGKTGVMSHVRFKSSCRAGKYGVDIRVIDDIGVPAIEEGLALGRIIIVDELARMELFSIRFRKHVLKALNSQTPFLGTIQQRCHPFLDLIRQRPDVKLIEITHKNRDTLVDFVKDQLVLKNTEMFNKS